MTKANLTHPQTSTSKRGLPARAAIALLTILTSCSLLTFSGDTQVKAQTAGTAGPAAPATRRITADLVTPAAAFAYYGAATAHTNGPGAWADYAPEIKALARGLGGNRLPVADYAKNVAKYVRDNIEMEFRFGLGKGARGAVIDQSGTSFDQAELMVKLMRAGGHAASYNVGTITLNAEQFGKWTGLVTNLNEANQTFTVNAHAACRFLADGGVPATVNGAGSCAGLSGDLSTVTMAHVWVSANGTTYDPAYKTHKLYQGIDIPAAMGCGTRANPTCGTQMLNAAMVGAQTGTLGGQQTLKNLNKNNIVTKLNSFVESYQTSMTASSTSLRLNVVLGEQKIDTTVAIDLASALPYVRATQNTFQDVPDQYRTRILIGLVSLSSEVAVPSTLDGFADDIAGRRIQVYHFGIPWFGSIPQRYIPTRLERIVYFDSTIVKSTALPGGPTTGSLPPYGTYTTSPTVQLSVKLPFPRAQFSGAEALVFKVPFNRSNSESLTERISIYFQLGQTRAALSHLSASEMLPGMVCADDCGSDALASSGMKMAQFQSNAAKIVSGVSNTMVKSQILVGVGVRAPIADGPSAGSGPANAETLNLASVASVVSKTSATNDEVAAFHVWATWQAELESIVLAQNQIGPVRATTSNYFTYQNQQGTRFVDVAPGQYSAVSPYIHGGVSNQRMMTASAAGQRLILNETYWGSICSLNVSAFVQSSGVCRPPGAEYAFSGNSDAATILSIFKGGASISAVTPGQPRASIGESEKGFAGPLGASAALNLAAETGVSAGPAKVTDGVKLSFKYSSSDVVKEDYASSVTGTNGNTDFFTSYNRVEDPEPIATGKIGGGWTHNYEIGATISSETGLATADPIGKSAAEEIVLAMVNFNLRQTETFGGILTSFLTLDWATSSYENNTISVKADSTSDSFKKLPNGSFVNLDQRGSKLAANSISWDSTARRFMFENANVVYTTKDGNQIEFRPSTKSFDSQYIGGWNTAETVRNPTYVASKISQANGKITTLNYTWFRMNGQSDGTFWPTEVELVLVNVVDSLGLSISFNYDDVIVGGYVWSSPPGSTLISPDDNRDVTFPIIKKRLISAQASNGSKVTIGRSCATAKFFTCDQMTFTRADNTVLKYDYTPSAAGGDSPQMSDPAYRPQYLLRRWYSPSDQNVPVQTVRYDELGRVASVTTKNSAGGTSTSNVYVGGVYSGENERRVEQVDAAGRSSLAFYDDRGQATRTVNEVGVQSRYEYDGLGRVKTAYSEESSGSSYKAGCSGPGAKVLCWRTEYEYDDRGNVTKETKYPYVYEGDFWWGQIEVTEAAYSTDFNKPLWVRGPYAQNATEAEKEVKKTSFEYDGRGLLTKMTQPVAYHVPKYAYLAPVTEYAYDAFGRVTREKGPSGQWTDMAYGEGGQPVWCPTSVTKSAQAGGLNLRSTATCTPAGDVATATDARGNLTEFTYDSMRRKETEKAYLGGTISSPLGSSKRMIYDLDGNVTRQGAWDGAVWKDMVSTYSPTGKVLTQTDPSGDVVKFDYDALDRVSIKTDPENRQVLTCYNAASQVLEEWRGTGLTTGQCGQAVSQASTSTPQRYVKNVYGGPNGAITEMYDPNNNKTVYGYQGQGRKVTSLWPDGTLEYHYRNETYAQGPLNGAYDRQGRVTYVYEDALRRPYVTYWMGDDLTWTALSVNYYDSAGNRTWAAEFNYTNGAFKTGRYFEYDKGDRVEYEWQSYGPTYANGVLSSWAADGARLKYEYDANGNRTKLQMMDTSLYTVASTYDYSYDALNRMKTIGFTGGSVGYDYDLLGRRTKVTRGNGTSTDYAYETDSDLDWMRHTFQGGASATAPNDNWVGIDYDYDKSGRVTLMSASDSRIMGAMPQAGSYGGANNLNQVASVPGRSAMTWSDAGNMKTDGKGTTFAHDGRNMLVKAVKSDGTTLLYAYNTDGLRIESIKNPTGTDPQANIPTGGTRTRFVLSGSEEVADLDASRNALRYFVPGPAIDERVAQIDANGAVTYMHTDRQSSVIAISDSSGNVSDTNRRAYGTYGETDPAQMTGASTHPFGYTGRRWDNDLGLYYYRARWYDPQLGTFLETDPIGSLDYVNLYAYVGLEPGNGTDPTGKTCVSNENTAVFCATIVNSPLSAQIVDTQSRPITPQQATEIKSKLGYSERGPSETVNAVTQPGAALKANAAANEARNDTVNSGLPGGHNGPADSYRHANASIRLERSVGSITAKSFGDAHERSGGGPIGETLMDLTNNNNGRVLSQIFPGADPATLALAAVRAGVLQITPIIVSP